MKKLYRFSLDCGRQGNIIGIFVEDEKIVKSAIGKDLYFSEPFGKHSEISETLKGDDLVVLTEDQDFIEKFQRYGCACGRNPLNYINDRED